MEKSKDALSEVSANKTENFEHTPTEWQRFHDKVGDYQQASAFLSVAIEKSGVDSEEAREWARMQDDAKYQMNLSLLAAWGIEGHADKRDNVQQNPEDALKASSEPSVVFISKDGNVAEKRQEEVEADRSASKETTQEDAEAARESFEEESKKVEQEKKLSAEDLVKMRIEELNKEIEQINQADGSGELTNKFGASHPEVFYNPQKWAEKEAILREQEIKRLEKTLKGGKEEQEEPNVPEIPEEPEKPKIPQIPETPEPEQDKIPEVTTVESPTIRQRLTSWGWWKERFKGLGTFGFWEVHQAERFRSQTGAVAEQVVERVQGAESPRAIEQLKHLNLEEALKEAETIRVATEGVPSEALEAKHYEQLSRAISAEKIKKNRISREIMIAGIQEQLRERLQKYKDQFGVKAEELLSDESRIKALQTSLEREFLLLEDGQIKEDARKFQTAIRTSLDQKYWNRYVYGAVELAMGATAFNYIVGWLLRPDVPLAQSSTEKLVHMKKTVWDSVKEVTDSLGARGVDNADLTELTKQVAQDNKVAVDIWGQGGDILDTKMPKGFPLKFGPGFISKFNALVQAGKITGKIITSF